MIALIVGGLVLLAMLAVVVGVVDSARASAWRRIAAARREQWETRRPEFHGSASEAWSPQVWDED